MIARLAKPLAWGMAGVLIVLATRTVAYALTPQSTALSLELERSAGGPRLLVLTAVVLGGALVIAVLVVGFAALAVRERLALERAPVLSLPRVRHLRVVGRAALLLFMTAAVFALLESYLHWRAGLGWHGLHCLTGPVHRDALPILAALSLVTAAMAEAVEHLVAWARRTYSRLLSRRRRLQPRRQRRRPIESRLSAFGWSGAPLPARGPPADSARAPAA